MPRPSRVAARRVALDQRTARDLTRINDILGNGLTATTIVRRAVARYVEFIEEVRADPCLEAEELRAVLATITLPPNGPKPAAG